MKEENLNTPTRPTYLEIDLGAISHNYNVITSKASKSKVMFVLKANAYGHGIVQIAEHLEDIGRQQKRLNYFGVAYVEEGIALREAGITTPILILGGEINSQIGLCLNHDLTITCPSIESLNDIDVQAQDLNMMAKVHIKIDTGMGRIGMPWTEANNLLSNTITCPHINIEGIYTHLAKADEEVLSPSILQLYRFEKVLSFYKHKKIKRPITHVFNSSGILQMDDDLIKSYNYDMVRAGLILYGAYPSYHLRSQLDLKPVMSLKTQVLFIKEVQPNQPISYGGTWSSNKRTNVVTLPIGYGDGYMRSLSNCSEVLIGGNRYPQVGTICMDQLMIDVGMDSVSIGDEVTLIGKQGIEEIRVEDVAQWAGTIPYEIMTNINVRVPRFYKKQDLRE